MNGKHHSQLLQNAKIIKTLNFNLENLFDDIKRIQREQQLKSFYWKSKNMLKKNF